MRTPTNAVRSWSREVHAFAVVVHDVAPTHWRAIATIAERVNPLVHGALAAAVVPRFHGAPLEAGGPAFRRFVDGAFGQLLVHGCTHRQDRANGFISALTQRSNEFGGISREDALLKLRYAKHLVEGFFGRAARGFVPPAWDFGEVDRALAAAVGLDFTMGMGDLVWSDVRERVVPLATWSWDAGRFAPLGHLGDLAGSVMRALRPAALPVVVLHPADVARGFLPRAERLISALLDEGRAPVVFETATTAPKQLTGRADVAA